MADNFEHRGVPVKSDELQSPSEIGNPGNGNYSSPTKTMLKRLAKCIEYEEKSYYHHEKRRRRLSQSPSGSESPPPTHLDLHTERTDASSGVPMHNPELYEGIRRAGEAGIYTGPGANIVVRYDPPSSSPFPSKLPQPQRSTAQGGNSASALPRIPDADTPVASVEQFAPLEEEAVLEPATASSPGLAQQLSLEKSVPVERNSPGTLINLQGKADGCPAKSSIIVEEDGKGGASVSVNRSSKVTEGQAQSVPGVTQSSWRVDSRSIEVSIKSTMNIADGVRLTDRPVASKKNKDDEDENNKENVGNRDETPSSYNSWFAKHKINETPQRMKRIGRERLMRAFPKPLFGTRRMRTWGDWKLEDQGTHCMVLARDLPAHPQLSRPYRRNAALPHYRHSRSYPDVVKKERSPTRLSPQEFPFQSIEEEESTDEKIEAVKLIATPETETQTPRPKTRRQAAMLGRQKLQELNPPSRARSNRRGKKGISIISSQAPSITEKKATVISENGSQSDQAQEDEKVKLEITEEGPKTRQKTKGKTKSKAPSRAPSKAPEKLPKKALRKPASRKGRETKKAPGVSKGKNKIGGTTSKGKRKEISKPPKRS